MTFHTLLYRSDVYLFADDIKLSRTIKNSDDIQILQDDIYTSCLNGLLPITRNLCINTGRPCIIQKYDVCFNRVGILCL